MPLADASLLHLIWLASPALPIGGFSYSEGLEAAMESRLVATESEAMAWLSDQMQVALARSDLAVVAQAIAAWRQADLARIHALNEWVLQSRETSELRLQSEQMGRSFIEWLKSVQPELTRSLNLPSPTYPVAFALAAAGTEAPLRDCLLSYAFGWAENMAQAAVRAVPLGQSSGQRILQRLAAEIPAAVDHALAQTEDSLQAFTPMLAILSAQHETQYSRLFRS